MAGTSPTVTTHDDLPIKKLAIRFPGHQPHWLRPGQAPRAWASMEFTGHVGAKWVSVVATDGCTSASGRVVSKQTMHHFTREQIAELYEFFGTILNTAPEATE